MFFGFFFTLKERRAEGLCKIPLVIPWCHVRWYRVVLVSGSTNSINDGADVMVRLNRWSDSAPVIFESKCIKPERGSMSRRIPTALVHSTVA